MVFHVKFAGETSTMPIEADTFEEAYAVIGEIREQRAPAQRLAVEFDRMKGRAVSDDPADKAAVTAFAFFTFALFTSLIFV